MKKPETLTDLLTDAVTIIVIIIAFAIVVVFIANEIIPRLEDFANTTI